jgi:hypothetical protein
MLPGGYEETKGNTILEQYANELGVDAADLFRDLLQKNGIEMFSVCVDLTHMKMLDTKYKKSNRIGKNTKIRLKEPYGIHSIKPKKKTLKHTNPEKYKKRQDQKNARKKNRKKK